VDNTPENPEQVPPSPEVREAQRRADEIRQVRKARRIALWPWGFVWVSGAFSVVVSLAVDNRYAQATVALLWLTMSVLYATWGTDTAYRRGFRLGVAAGAYGASQAMRKFAEGSEPGEALPELRRVEANAPHYWEHGVVLDNLERMIAERRPQGDE
jgi:hypothetical protein